MIWRLILHLTGSDSTTSYWYAFWSGFAGDLPVIGGLWIVYWHHTCHYPSCWRIVRAGHKHCGKHQKSI